MAIGVADSSKNERRLVETFYFCVVHDDVSLELPSEQCTNKVLSEWEYIDELAAAYEASVKYGDDKHAMYLNKTLDDARKCDFDKIQPNLVRVRTDELCECIAVELDCQDSAKTVLTETRWKGKSLGIEYFEDGRNSIELFKAEKIQKKWSPLEIAKVNASTISKINAGDNSPLVQALQYCQSLASCFPPTVSSLPVATDGKQLCSVTETMIENIKNDGERWFRKRQNGMTPAAIAKQEGVPNYGKGRSGEQKIRRESDKYAKENSFFPIVTRNNTK